MHLSGSLILLVFAAVLVWMALNRHYAVQKEAQSRAAKGSRGPRVVTIRVTRSPPVRRVDLIGEARPFLSTSLYARVSGYLKEVRVDKGDRVQKDQILAVIESPETDRAYLAALADATNRGRIADRYRILRRRKLVSQQETDQAVASADIARQTLETQKVLRDYEELRAPFDGIITSRLVDPGALIQNGSNSPSAQILFTISQTDRLRVYVYVDQKDAPFVKPGAKAILSFADRPEVRFEAAVSRIAGELDPRTRTLLTEIDFDNRQQLIVAGSYIPVTLLLPVPSYLEVPVKALVTRQSQSVVPVIDASNRIHYTPVDIIGNDGQTLRIRSGLKEGEQVALDIGNSLAEGQKVEVQPQMAGQFSR